MNVRNLRIRREQYRTFKYFQGFVEQWSRLGLTDDDLHELELQILSNPDGAPVMPESLRKLRFAPSRWHRGRSGALRVGYSHNTSLEKVLVIAVYAKNDQANLTRAERREIKQLLDRVWESEST